MDSTKEIDKKQKKLLKIVLQAVACGLLIAILFLSGHLHGKSSAKAYVYVDVNRVMRAIVDSLDAENLSADELNAQIDSHRRKFQELLSDYSASDNVMIIAKPKVISGAPDKTDFFIEKLLGGEA